jgi:hypothetical protein
MAKAKDAAEVAHGNNLLAQAQSIISEAQTNLQLAREAGNIYAANGALDQARKALELLAQLMGELQIKAEQSTNQHYTLVQQIIADPQLWQMTRELIRRLN